MKRIAKLLGAIGLWGFTISLILACLLMIRIFMAPLDIAAARTFVLNEARDLLPGWNVNYKEARVAWDWRAVGLTVQIDDLSLVDRRDRLRAYSPHVRLDVAFSSIFTGLRMSGASIENAAVTITNLGAYSDTTDGDMLGNLFGESGLPRPEVLLPITEAFSRFGVRLLDNAPDFREITLSNAMVTVHRGPSLPEAAFNIPSFRVTNQTRTLGLYAQVDARLAELPTQVILSGSAEPEIGELKVSLSFSDLRPPSLASQFKLPEFITYLDFPVSLSLDLDMAANVGLRSLRYRADIDEGALRDDIRFPEPGVIRYGTIGGQYSVAEATLSIDTLEVAAGDRLLTGEGLVFWINDEDAPGIRFDARADEVSLAEVLRYWPQQIYPDGSPRGARLWVTQHMRGGVAENVRFQLNRRPDGTGPFEDGSIFNLTFNVRDVDTLFLETMPPVEHAYGAGSLTRYAFKVALEGGDVLGMDIAGSTAVLKDIHIPFGATGIFDVKLSGSVPKVMELISYPPLSVPEKLNFDAARLSGQAEGRAVITLPLIKGVPKEDIRYNVEADIQDAGVTDLLGGEGLRKGDLKLVLSNDDMDIEGQGNLNGVPLNLRWFEDFAAARANETAQSTLLVLSGALDEKDLKALGVDLSDFLEGKAQGEATFLGRSLKVQSGFFSADTIGATLMVPQIGWKKGPDRPVSVTGALTFDDTGTHLSPLVAVGEETDAKAAFFWGKDGSMTGEFDLAELGRNSFRGTLRQEAEGPTTVEIAGARFDVAPLLLSKGHPKADARDGDKRGSLLSVDVDAMLLTNGVEFRHASLDAKFEGGSPTDVTFEAASGPSQDADATGDTVKLTIAPGESPDWQSMSLKAPDAGLVLRGLGFFPHFEGGSFDLEGKTHGWGDQLVLSAEMIIRDTRMVSVANKPEITEGAIKGLDDYVKDGAVKLDIVDMKFLVENSILDIGKMRANGPSLGMTMEGQVDTAGGVINVNGVLVPAYGVNALLGKIPLLGGLFTGGEGKGLFGVSYRVKGQTSGPEISVNALSGLAPGFLRLLFEGKKGKVADVEPVPQESAEPTPETEGAKEEDPTSTDAGPSDKPLK